MNSNNTNNNAARSTQRREAVGNVLLSLKWDPLPLKLLRKFYCIPISLVTLIAFMYTSLSSNWINVRETHRLGIFKSCNVTVFIEYPTNDPNDTVKTVTENCNFSIIFREAFKEISLLLIIKCGGYLFHLLGIYLLAQSILGNSVLRSYYCHSAGESFLVSTLTGCFVLVLLNSLAKTNFDQNYTYGYCFYIYMGAIGLNLISAITLNLDDYVKDAQYLLLKLRQKK